MVKLRRGTHLPDVWKHQVSIEILPHAIVFVHFSLGRQIITRRYEPGDGRFGVCKPDVAEQHHRGALYDGVRLGTWRLRVATVQSRLLQASQQRLGSAVTVLHDALVFACSRWSDAKLDHDSARTRCSLATLPTHSPSSGDSSCGNRIVPELTPTVSARDKSSDWPSFNQENSGWGTPSASHANRYSCPYLKSTPTGCSVIFGGTRTKITKDVR